VAELFRQCLESAQAFRQRQRHSNRRLLWTVGGATGVLVGMAALALALIFGTPHEQRIPLENKVENYRSREGETPSARLRGDLPSLQAKISQLTELKNDPNFGRLPQEDQDYVTQRLDELEAYRAYKAQLQQVRPVAAAHSEADLKEIEESLAKLEPPPAYQKEWSQTDAVLARDQRLKDVAALRRAIDDAEDWYRGLKREGERLLNFAVGGGGSGEAGEGWGAWYEQFRKLQDRAGSPRFREDEPVPGSAEVSYATVLRFNRVAEARDAWEAVKQRLDRVRDLAAALGRIGPLPGRPAVLVIPQPPDFNAQEARNRVAELARAYPHYKEDFKVNDLPERTAERLRRSALSNYDRLLEAGRDEVLRHLQAVSPDGKETVEHWRELRPWLADPEDLASWRVLAGVLGPLQDPAWADPVNALASFLSRDRFDLDLKRLTLEVPFNLNVRPAGKLSVHHLANNEQTTLTFEVGDPETDMERRVRIYPLRPEGSPRVLVYRPGDSLWASMPVEYDDKPGWVVDWVRGRSAVYQFDHLRRVPQLHQKDQDSTRGEPAQGVVLAPSAGSTLPAVPDLMPVVKLEKR